MVLLEIMWIDLKYSKDSTIEFACFIFHVGLPIVTLSSLKLHHTENNACMLQSFSCFAWIFVNNPRNWWQTDSIPASREISLTVRWLWGLSSWLSNSDSTVSTLYVHCVCRCPDACRLFWTSSAACWCCSSSKLCSELCYKLPSVVTFTFIPIFDQNFCLLYWTSEQFPRLLDTASRFALFSVSGLKDEKLIKKQTYMKNEACKLYPRDFWIFLPNVIKIDPYSFEL